MQHAVNVLPAIFNRLFCSELPDLLVFFLEFLQPQSHAPNAGFVRNFEG